MQLITEIKNELKNCSKIPDNCCVDLPVISTVHSFCIVTHTVAEDCSSIFLYQAFQVLLLLFYIQLSVYVITGLRVTA